MVGELGVFDTQGAEIRGDVPEGSQHSGNSTGHGDLGEQGVADFSRCEEENTKKDLFTILGIAAQVEKYKCVDDSPLGREVQNLRKCFSVMLGMTHKIHNKLRKLTPKDFDKILERVQGQEDWLLQTLNDKNVTPFEKYTLKSLNTIIQDNKKSGNFRLEALKEVMGVYQKISQKEGEVKTASTKEEREERMKRFEVLSKNMDQTMKQVSAEMEAAEVK